MTLSVRSLASLAACAALSMAGAALAQSAVNPTLAPNIEKAASYAAPTDKYVVAHDTPVFATLNYYGPKTGEELKRGQPVEIIASTMEGHWLLIGRNGTGVGYVPRSLVTPERYAKDLNVGAG